MGRVSCAKALFWFAIVSLLSEAQILEKMAEIRGQVVDATGQPLQGANISLFPAGAFSGGLPFAVTDEHGRYHLVSPPYGKAWLSAVKESAGYPDTNALLFAGERDDRPEVFLVPGAHLDVDIHLGPPDGILKASVIDNKTRDPLSVARLIMRRAEPSAVHSRTIPADGHFLFALPPVSIQISVTAPGYMPWNYIDPHTGSDKLKVSSSDHLTITIPLEAQK